MKWIVDHWDEDAFNYWTTVALAVFFVWHSGAVDDRARLVYLFGAAYLLIHAHGRRILAAVKQRDEAAK